MNSSIEHDLLLFSRYKDGRLEYFNSDNKWVQAEQSALIEGQ